MSYADPYLVEILENESCRSIIGFWWNTNFLKQYAPISESAYGLAGHHERHEPGSTIRPGQLEKSTQPGLSTRMAVTRSSRTSSSTSYSKNVNPCDVHNQPPANLFKSISTEPNRDDILFVIQNGEDLGKSDLPTVARPTPASKKLLAIPTNSAVGVSQARSHRHSNSDVSEHCKRSFKPIDNHRAKRRMGNLKSSTWHAYVPPTRL
ncbi:hypothetical protein DER44DRAFT_849736 [Fusarium oxysporum]|nr:hypothetical protein DER44DRAFT_849736 [Fusarium oxysporum]